MHTVHRPVVEVGVAQAVQRHRRYLGLGCQALERFGEAIRIERQSIARVNFSPRGSRPSPGLRPAFELRLVVRQNNRGTAHASSIQNEPCSKFSIACAAAVRAPSRRDFVP